VWITGDASKLVEITATRSRVWKASVSRCDRNRICSSGRSGWDHVNRSSRGPDLHVEGDDIGEDSVLPIVCLRGIGGIDARELAAKWPEVSRIHRVWKPVGGARGVFERVAITAFSLGKVTKCVRKRLHRATLHLQMHGNVVVVVKCP